MRLFEALALCNASIPERGVEYRAELLLSLECMDKAWQDKVAALKILSNVRPDKFDAYMKERETEFIVNISANDIEALLEAIYSVDNKNTEEKAA